MKNRVVRLNAEDALMAIAASSMQMLRKIAKERNGDHGGTSRRSMRERWADTIHGAMAELALSRLLHLEWTPGGMQISRGDVANRLEVRATEWPDGHLLIYPSDADDSLFVLMVGHYPDFRFAGCMFGFMGKSEGWWRPHADPPCFWIPQGSLLDFEDVCARAAE